MKVKWELADPQSRRIYLTARYRNALLEVLKAECEMMQKTKGENPEYWTWGRAIVDELCTSPSFIFGGDDDMPKDGLGPFAVVRKVKW